MPVAARSTPATPGPTAPGALSPRASAGGGRASAPTATPGAASRVPAPDLGIVRYRDPTAHRELWLGVDLGGVYLPEALGVFDRDVWTLRAVGAWALALTPRVAAGGRHGLVFYDASNTRLQVQEHQVELSGSLMPSRRPLDARDRLSATLEFHTLDRTWTDGHEFAIGGVGDSVVAAAYGTTHRLADAWEFGWNLQPRFVWVFRNTQRQLRGSVRLLWLPGSGHQLGVETTAYLVHRDASQRGNPFPRATVHAVVSLEHILMWSDVFGTLVALRYASGFMSGQAPMYEVREEAVNASYGELHAGIRVAW